MKMIIEPFRAEGSLSAIPSKSAAHRALICAATAVGDSRILLDKSSVDIDATAQALNSVGADIERTDYGFLVRPIQPNIKDGNNRNDADADADEDEDEVRITAEPLVNARESGSTLRFLLPIAAVNFDRVRFTGEGRLPQRPIGPLLEAMSANGAVFSDTKLPLTIERRMTGTSYRLPGDISSQFVSGLLMASPGLLGDVEIHLSSTLESEDYVNITLAVMADFGVTAEKTADGFRVPGGQTFRGRTSKIEGDWSNAAFFLAAGALSGKVSLTGLDPCSVQGDRGILEVLEAFGARLTWETEEKTGPATGASVITCSSGERHNITVDLTRMPDSLPILAVLAASADTGVSYFTNGRRLRLKESDRLHTVAAMITDLGGRVRELPDSLEVFGTGGLQGGTTSSFGDHRLAMAAAVAAVISNSPVVIEDAQAVEKSYPGFYEDLKKTGGIVHAQQLRK